MKKLLAILAALVVVGVAAYFAVGGSAGLVEAALPEFPVLPTPTLRLADERGGEIYFATRTPTDLDVILADAADGIATTGMGTLFMPEEAAAESPVPAMVVLHGSGGITPGREMEYGKLLSDSGIAAFVVDYYSPRGITDETPYMLRVISVTEFDVVADAYASLQLLSSHPAIDAERIGVVGFSYGGMAARFAMDERIREALAPGHPGFAVYVDYYGPCFQKLGTRKTNGAPLLTFRGTEDKSNDLEACARREEELRALGVAVEAHVYEGAGHAWEATRERALFPDSPYVAGCEVRYDDSGRSSVDGRPIVDVPLETGRAERIAVRMKSSEPLQDCVKSGYVIGRDDETRAKSDATLQAFLQRVFAL
ncbi:MAG: dienelactone hydrolase family protein [Deltaproteobacteria bacterium]|nr:dienelactone hydrolase family protein [Deltaproteobacteria bacterium]MBW2363028.1 dienelactone hydrolase family protein [Deltaproteobacteria bacterium]